MEENKQEIQFTQEEAEIYFKKSYKREIVKREEIRDEVKQRMCKFFAYDFDCPDLIEFGECAFQHDERLLKAHRIKEK